MAQSIAPGEAYARMHEYGGRVATVITETFEREDYH